MLNITTNQTPLALLAVALLIRWLVAQFPYSGQATPPMYGDYEAQRHWMEITTNLPAQDWYQNTTQNDLMYWGLDYPPLTAYHMFLLGYVSKTAINESWTQLYKSRGFESQDHKLYMRATVLLADVVFYMDPLIYYYREIQPTPSHGQGKNVIAYTAFALLYPAQILIDHGHFQYNCVFMGLVTWAVIFIQRDRRFLAAAMFTLALSYKQMSLYYSLPFFWYIFSVNLREKPLLKGFRNIILTGVVVMALFALIFSPFIQSKNLLMQVINRIFPFKRGLFEDKVANLWFSLSVFYKFRNFYSISDLLGLSSIATMAATLPTGIHLLVKPSKRAFMYSLVNASLAFFLLSFQVHEKTILVPALPILLLIGEHPMAVSWFSIISTFSLQPLLFKDGQTIPYMVLFSALIILSLEMFQRNLMLTPKIFSPKNLFIVMYLTSIVGCCILNVMALTIAPPERYPDIHPTVNAIYCCLHFTCFLLFFNYKQFYPESRHTQPADKISQTKKNK